MYFNDIPSRFIQNDQGKRIRIVKLWTGRNPDFIKKHEVSIWIDMISKLHWSKQYFVWLNTDAFITVTKFRPVGETNFFAAILMFICRCSHFFFYRPLTFNTFLRHRTSGIHKIQWILVLIFKISPNLIYLGSH